MGRTWAESFPEAAGADLAADAEARAADIDLGIEARFWPHVLENLAALQAHARRVDAALQGLNGAASREARGI